MPFITPERRKSMEESSILNPQSGDLCYRYYVNMVRKWRASPRWTTAHEIYKYILCTQSVPESRDNYTARELAWQVFFQLEVIPYELRKREENGDVE